MFTISKFIRIKGSLLLCAYISTGLSICLNITMAAELTGHNFYQVKQIDPKLGVEVRGINLKDEQPIEVIDQIKKDIHKYRLMVFRDQGIISGQRHVEIGRWFGDIDSTFYRHPASPDLDVFRVSNDEVEGCTGVGRTGWHVDGSFQPAPFSYSLMHIWSVPKKGDTVFVPLLEMLQGLPQEQMDRWERLWMVSDKRINRIHPLVYSHPITGQKTMCFHLGMIEAFVWDYGNDDEKWTDWRETESILSEIFKELVKDNGALQYSHKWEQGDFILSDNLALGHEASKDTQLPRSEVGLRVMHRVTVKGFRPPAKEYNISKAKQEL